MDRLLQPNTDASEVLSSLEKFNVVSEFSNFVVFLIEKLLRDMEVFDRVWSEKLMGFI